MRLLSAVALKAKAPAESLRALRFTNGIMGNGINLLLCTLGPGDLLGYAGACAMLKIKCADKFPSGAANCYARMLEGNKRDSLTGTTATTAHHRQGCGNSVEGS